MQLPDKFQLRFKISLHLSLLFLSFVLAPWLGVAHAGATLNNLTDTLTSVNAATATTHTITFNITSGSAITAIVLTANTAWGTQPTAGWIVKDAGVSKSVSSVTATSSTVFTINTTFTPTSSTDQLTIITPSITNWAANNNILETINTGNETGQVGLQIVAAGANTVTLNASVGPSISFSISPSTLSLPSGGGNLALSSNSANVSNNETLTLSTNASHNTIVTVSDTGGALTSGSNTIPSVASGPIALNASNQFGMGETTGAPPSSGTIAASFSTSGNTLVGPLSSTPTTFWTVTGPVSNVTATPYFNAYITGTTPAGSYTDAVTYIATATF